MSRENRSLIQFSPVESPTCVDILQAHHQIIESLGVARAPRKFSKPFAKSFVERCALRSRGYVRPLNQVSVGA